MIVIYDELDVTEDFRARNSIAIPAGDAARTALFGEPKNGRSTTIAITDDFGQTREFGPETPVTLDRSEGGKFALPKQTPREKLAEIHRALRFSHGSLQLEYPEQLMAVANIEPHHVVLEIGGNIGRNSCVIASILANSSNLVVFESDPDSAKKLIENRDANGFSFFVETCAISNRRLVQNGWNTRVASEADDDGWTPVDAMTWSQVRAKHVDKRFDCLVADCEGALFGILRDEPDFLETFTTVIIENDFTNLEEKLFVDSELARFGLRAVYREAGGFGPCFPCFYEVWKR